MRLQLALNVNDLDQAVDFYSTLFDTTPHKRRPGYANFAIDQPPLKLVLFEQPGEGGTLNHLGVEAEDGGAVTLAAERLSDSGYASDVREQELCCHAVQDKVWTAGPDAEPWEVYVVTEDEPADTADQAPAVCCT